jgi:hypothetical protein
VQRLRVVTIKGAASDRYQNANRAVSAATLAFDATEGITGAAGVQYAFGFHGAEEVRRTHEFFRQHGFTVYPNYNAPNAKPDIKVGKIGLWASFLDYVLFLQRQQPPVEWGVFVEDDTLVPQESVLRLLKYMLGADAKEAPAFIRMAQGNGLDLINVRKTQPFISTIVRTGIRYPLDLSLGKMKFPGVVESTRAWPGRRVPVLLQSFGKGSKKSLSKIASHMTTGMHNAGPARIAGDTGGTAIHRVRINAFNNATAAKTPCDVLATVGDLDGFQLCKRYIT